MSQTRDGAANPPADFTLDQREIERKLEEAEKEELKRYRTLPPAWRKLFYAATVISTLLAINQLFNIHFFGAYVLIDNRYLYLLAMVLMPFVFIVLPAGDKAPRDRVPWYDIALAVANCVLLGYFVWQADHILEEGWEYSAPLGAQVASLLLWLTFCEIGRRAGGWVIFWITLIWSTFPIYVHLMPSFISGVNQSVLDTAGFHMMSAESFLGAPMRAFGGLVFGFLIFGIAMQYTGAGAFFINIAFALLGAVRGGPAKVAIFASGLFGSMSGSVISNVLTTGSMTIPAMIKVGFPRKVAGAIEANASTGGTLMPPVMGAVAFVMASYLNVPYGAVAIAAFLPSLLYYFGLFMQIDAFAAKHQIIGLPRSAVPGLWQTIKDGWYYCVSFAVLIWMLLWLQRESTAPFYATAVLLIINQISPKHRMSWEKFKLFVYGSGLVFVELIGVLAPIGLIIGALVVTGILGTLTNDLVFIAGHNTLILLIMGAVTSFILGMGMTSTACYIFLAVVLAPALTEAQGLDKMAVHLFLLYWGMVSFITPPVALAAFAASGLARASPWDTGIEACKLGSIMYFVPFFFVYNPALLFKGTPIEILVPFVTAILGIILIAAALQDYLVGYGILGTSVFGFAGRLLIFLSGLVLAQPIGTAGLAGMAIVLETGKEVLIAAALLLAGVGVCRVARPRIATA